jgi:stress response protein YsnF
LAIFFELPVESESVAGAHDRTRTGDLVLTKDVLYQLSYVGVPVTARRVPARRRVVIEKRETRFELATLSLEG